MRLFPCSYRQSLQTVENTYLCAHPRVHSHDHLVTSEICQLCDLHQSQEQARPVEAPLWLHSHQSRVPIAVGVVCNQRSHHLGEVLASIVGQTCLPSEIVVLDQSNDKSMQDIVKRYQGYRVRYQGVAFDSLQSAWTTLIAHSRAEYVCLLQAEEWFTPGWIQAALSVVSESSVGVVCSEIEWINSRPQRWSMRRSVRQGVVDEPQWFPITGCLVRRKALLIAAIHGVSEGSNASIDGKKFWTNILSKGWKVTSHDGVLRSMNPAPAAVRGFLHENTDSFSYHPSEAGLIDEMITLFIPLAGRTQFWPRLAEYLDIQSWPHEQIQLLLMDTSQDESFSKHVRSWLGQCDYSDFRYVRYPVGEPGLADLPRFSVQIEVARAMARIYNWVAKEARSRFVWIIEDDVVPPKDACLRLLQGFDHQTASVSGCYLSRIASGFVAWDSDQNRFTHQGEGIEEIGGNGFGCVLLRSAAMDQIVFATDTAPSACDTSFYKQLQFLNWKVKMNWSVKCQHP